MQRMMGLMRSCIDDYHMIEEGDRIAVGVSGGKDSLTLLAVLAALRAYYPRHFELEAVTVDMGLEGMDFSGVEAFCREKRSPIRSCAPRSGRSFSITARRRIPARSARRCGGARCTTCCSRTAATRSRSATTTTTRSRRFLMSLFYEGRISCFEPVTYLTRTGITQIRPMLYIGEKAIARFAEQEGLPVVHNTCPADKHTKRQEVKELIASLQTQYPDLKTKLFGAMQRLPLNQWGVER
jgi:tRNA 2-thiocytidine biosynthesis protein TtcA